MILADTTIWIDHFRFGNTEMRRQPANRNIAIRPYVVAELALGSIRDRAKTLAWLDFLPRVRILLVALTTEIGISIHRWAREEMVRLLDGRSILCGLR